MPAPSTPPFVFHRIDPRLAPDDLPAERGRRPADYEYRVAVVPRRTSIARVRAALTEQAEYGRWELARTRLYLGGEKKVWLRRRIIRVRPTLFGQDAA